MKADLWKANIVRALESLADLEKQRSTTEFFPHPGELLCQLWDDTGLTEFFKRGAVFTPALDTAFMELSELHDKVDLNVSISGLHMDPQWQHSARLATEIAAMLRDTPVLPNPSFSLE